MAEKIYEEGNYLPVTLPATQEEMDAYIKDMYAAQVKKERLKLSLVDQAHQQNLAIFEEELNGTATAD